MIDVLGEMASGAAGGVAKAAVPAVAEGGLKSIAGSAPGIGAEAVGATANIVSNIPETVGKEAENMAAGSLADSMEQALASTGSDSALGELLKAKPEGTSGRGLSSLNNESIPIAEPSTITPEGSQSAGNTAHTLSSEPVMTGSASEPSNLTGQEPITPEGGPKVEAPEEKVPAGETPEETIPQVEQELRELTLDQRMERLEKKMDSLFERLDKEWKRGEKVDKNVEELLKKVEELRRQEEARKRENEELARQNQEMAEKIRALEEQQKELLETVADVDDKRKAEIVQIAEAKRTESQGLTESLNQQKQAV